MLHNLDIVLPKVLISDYIDGIFRRRRHKKYDSSGVTGAAQATGLFNVMSNTGC